MPLDAHGNAPVHRLISAVARRRWWQQFALSTLAATSVMAAIALGARVTGVALTPPYAIALVCLVAAAAMGWSRRLRTRRAAAEAIETSRPSCHNLVITAEEMMRHPQRYSAPIVERVVTRASRATEGLHPRTVAPAGRTITAFAASVGVSLLVVTDARLPIEDGVAQLARSLPQALAGAARVRVTIDPPSYAARERSVLADPERIEVLEGSRIRFDVPREWRVRFGDAPVTGEFLAADGGYFAVEPSSSDDRRLIPLIVIRDRAPSVRISAPAKDLLLPDGSKTIPVQMTAVDDLGLASLELRFTRVSGSGEQFEFVEGTLPVSIERSSAREWTARARLALPSLRLQAGDSLVYRAVARDRRPGDAGFAASDTYFIEIAGPGQVPLEGVDMPPEMERYAMSQQMIVVKLERLRTRQAVMTRTAVEEEAASIAAEQRTVRGNFIFLLGGHVEDEEEEAAQSHEIQEGRLENTARKDISAAISQMTKVEQGLAAVDVRAALPPARAAVESLQRAFGRSRYLLRALAVRSRLDSSRRLTGDLSGAVDWRRTAREPEERGGEESRRLLEDLVAVAAEALPEVPERARLRQLAESALAVDPGSAVWQDIARRLLAARDAAAVRDVIARVSSEALEGTIPRTPLAERESRLQRALRTERRP